MRKGVLTAVLAAALLTGCGGGGGGGGSSPAHPELKGTYRLTGFTIAYNNGVTITEKSAFITSWSGTMDMGPTTIKQTFVINGQATSASWPYTVEWDTNNSGTFHSGDQWADFTMIDGNQTTHAYGPDFEEWDYWHKISDSYTVKAPEVEEEENGKPIWVAELLK